MTYRCPPLTSNSRRLAQRSRRQIFITNTSTSGTNIAIKNVLLTLGEIGRNFRGIERRCTRQQTFNRQCASRNQTVRLHRRCLQLMEVYAFILKSRVNHLWLCVRITGNLSHRTKCCACVRDLLMMKANISVTTTQFKHIGYNPHVKLLLVWTSGRLCIRALNSTNRSTQWASQVANCPKRQQHHIINCSLTVFFSIL